MAVGFALIMFTAAVVAGAIWAVVLTLAFATHNAVRPESDAVEIPEAFEAVITGILYAVSHFALYVPAQRIKESVDAAFVDAETLGVVAVFVLAAYGEFLLMGLIVGVRHDLTIGQTGQITISMWLYSIVVGAVVWAILGITGTALFDGANY